VSAGGQVDAFLVNVRMAGRPPGHRAGAGRSLDVYVESVRNAINVCPQSGCRDAARDAKL
jgi:hypothetical protein